MRDEPRVDPIWEKTIVSLVIAEETGFRQYGTAFLVTPEMSSERTDTILVTARHLITTLSPELRSRLGYRYKTKSGGSAVILDKDLLRNGGGDWYIHPEADVACRLLGTYQDGDTLCSPTNLFLAKEGLTIGANVFLTRFPGKNPKFVGPTFEKGKIVELGEPLGIKSPLRVGYDGGPAVYVRDSKSLPLTTWNLGLIGLVSDPKSIRSPDEAASIEQKIYAIVPADRILEAVEGFNQSRKEQVRRLGELISK